MQFPRTYAWKDQHKRTPKCILCRADAWQTSKALEVFNDMGESEGLICSVCVFDIYTAWYLGATKQDLEKIEKENKS